jgi:hypothetical protein
MKVKHVIKHLTIQNSDLLELTIAIRKDKTNREIFLFRNKGHPNKEFFLSSNDLDAVTKRISLIV